MALRTLAAIAFAAIPVVATGEDYLGLLKPSRAGLSAPPGFFALSSEPVSPFATARPSDNGIRLKLGYRYSRYFSVEGEFVDFGRTPQEIFATQGNLASAFRASGYGVDTVATVPLWRSFSFYGRLGATRGETRNAFSAYSTSLLGDHAMRGARWRYGLGMRYDFTKAFGIRAELERYSPLGSTLASDAEADLFTVGVMWRF